MSGARASRSAAAPPCAGEDPRRADQLLIRPISPDDKHALVDGFERLSQESRYRRFLAPQTRLSGAELRYLTEVDHHDHEALVAVDPLTGEGVGIARYVRSRRDRAVAELAIAVVDDWQGIGVGTRLLKALADRARQEGICAFRGLVLADNDVMLSLARELGAVRLEHQQQGTVELTVDFSDRGPASLARLLKAVAGGELRPCAARHAAHPT